MYKFYKSAIFFIIPILLLIVISEILLRFYVTINPLIYDLEMMKYAINIKKIETVNGNSFLSHKSNKNKIKIMGVKISTDKNGFRINSIQADNELNKIILLGDSMTFGFGSKFTFADFLQKKFINKYKIYNAGIGNTNTIMQVDNFFYNLKNLKSIKYIILNFYINDLEHISLKKNPILEYFYIYNFIDFRLKILFQKKKYNYVNFYKKTFLDQQMKNATFKKIRKLKDYCDNQNINFVVNIIPDLRNPKNYAFYDEELILKNFLKKNQINYVENLNQFQSKNPEEYWVSLTDPHPNELSHELLSINIGNYIEKN